MSLRGLKQRSRQRWRKLQTAENTIENLRSQLGDVKLELEGRTSQLENSVEELQSESSSLLNTIAELESRNAELQSALGSIKIMNYIALGIAIIAVIVMLFQRRTT